MREIVFHLILRSIIVKRGPAYRFIDGGPRLGPSSSAISHQDRTAYHHSGLIKQAYSAWVTPFGPESRPQKWHITAYFTYNDLPHLPTVDHDLLLRKIIVPNGMYRSSHSRTRADHDKGDDPSAAHGDRSLHGDTNPHATLPSLAALAVCPHPPPSPARHPLPPHGARLPEDQRLIHMLNSRHIR